jgi:hypothetical protein
VTQQVVKASVIIAMANPQIPNPSMDFVFEATGSETTLDFTASDNPLIAISHFFAAVAIDQVKPVCAYFSSEYNRANPSSVEWYDITAHLDGSPAGSPFRIDSLGFSTDSSGTADLHPALCGVLAYRRAYGSAPEVSGHTRPRARDRGRVHIGPLTNACQADGTGKMGVQFKADLTVAAGTLATTHNLGAANQFAWVQWSRMNASVGNIADIATQYGLGVDRRRVDESSTRVLAWAPPAL